MKDKKNKNKNKNKSKNPKVKPEDIIIALEELGGPVGFPALVKALGVSADDDTEIENALMHLQHHGFVVQNRAKQYGLASHMDLVTGRVSGHRDGFGFLLLDGESKDLFLSPRQMQNLMHGDKVMARLAGYDRRGRPEGKIVQILERSVEKLVGRLITRQNIHYVLPDNQRIQHEILIPSDLILDAGNGDMVVVEMTQYPERKVRPMGKIIEVLGSNRTAGMEVDIAIRNHQLPNEFPNEVSEEAETFGKTIANNQIKARKDIRNLPLVTIDGEDAKDFDDAVLASKTSKGYKLLVAIADVAHYVANESALDTEAKKRGNSVYFPNKVIPMLPEVLSNGLCSLVPDEDRLCVVCEMEISMDGEIGQTKFYRAVMCSHARLTYNQVAGYLLEDQPPLENMSDEVQQSLRTLYELYKLFRVVRDARGAIDIDTTEMKFVFDANGDVSGIEAVQRNDAHRLIEECMIAANICAAKVILGNQMNALYRVHEQPLASSVEDLRAYLSQFKIKLGGGETPQPKDYSRVFREIGKRPDAAQLQTLVLRSLRQAEYRPELKGHFGLALATYAHFTSPIRRYADLIVHRVILQTVKHCKGEKCHYPKTKLEQIGEHLSMTERRADEASRDVNDWLKCEYMENQIGQEFNATVTTVVNFGLFVELKGSRIEGLVHVSSLGKDYFHYEAQNQRLIGERTSKQYTLGDKLRVRLTKIDFDDRKIDFELVGVKKRSQGKSKRRRK